MVREVTMTLTFDHQNQISSLLIPSKRWCKIWRNSPFLEILYSRMRKMQGHSDFNLWLPKSNRFILESKRMFVPDLKKFLQGILWDMHSQKWDRLLYRRTTQKYNASSYSYHWCRRIKKIIFGSAASVFILFFFF